MNRRQAITKACLLLRRQAKEESLARFLLMYMLDEMREFNENLALELTEEDEQKYFQLINKHIKDDTPLSHLVGFEYFYDRKFKVTSDVLSPRMETEELVYKVIDYIRKNNLTNIKILDLCTGSGIIGITLKKELEEFDVKILASDISSRALTVAKENASSLEADISFVESDLFSNIQDKFDIIVSNPPYIAHDDKKTIKENVLNYDPHLALFADEEGMYFYRNIIEKSRPYLNEKGIMFFEIGYDQKEKIITLGENNKFETVVYKDINGRDRIAVLKSQI
ncbi:peptide chain release factor N(5)-glutamine methyltransferase [Gemella morbillorum]